MARRKQSGAKVGPTVGNPAEASLVTSSDRTVPILHRFSSHRTFIDLAMKALERDRVDLITKRDQLRLQTSAVDHLFAQQLAEIDAALGMYQGGLDSSAISQD